MHLLKSLLILLGVCLSAGNIYSQINPNWTAIPPSYNINSSNPVQVLDVAYDDDDISRQSFHLFLPDTSSAHSLVIYIHGGGFVAGSKDEVFSTQGLQLMKYYLDQNIAFASLGYRLLETSQQDTVGVKKCLYDSKRGLQFIRHYQGELFIDPGKIALFGTSAGAGTVLWLGTKDDMADLGSADPVLRESTRVCAIETSGVQATYDLYKWETEVYNDWDGMGSVFSVEDASNLLGFQTYSNFYGGLDSNYQILYDPALIQYRQDVDMLVQLSSDDPPLYIKNTSQAVTPSQDLYHHSRHGEVLNNTAVAAGLPEVLANISAVGVDNTQGENGYEFLVRHLGICSLNLSLEEKEMTEFKIYPNPSKSKVFIQSDLTKIDLIEVYTLEGKIVLNYEGVNSFDFAFDVEQLSGLYLVRIQDQNGHIKIKKLVVEQ